MQRRPVLLTNGGGCRTIGGMASTGRRLHRQVWLLVNDPDPLPIERAAEARRLWNRWGMTTVDAVAELAVLMLAHLAASEARRGFRPGPPPSEVAAALGPHGEEISAETWNILAGRLLGRVEGVDDPLARDQLEALAAKSGPDTILMCAWWGLRAVSTMAVRDRDAFPDLLRSAHGSWVAA